MNDFTKEELEGMLLCISHGSWIYKAEKSAVINKLQSMIDNYCEHPINNVCMECLSATCEICNKIYGLKDE